MSKVVLVTDDDLARARQDPAFRHHMIAGSLNILLNEIKKLRAVHPDDAGEGLEIREGVKLAVALAELLQRIASTHPDASNAA